MTKAFWVKLKLVDGLDVQETNSVLDEYFAFTESLNCSSDGAPIGPWSWKELVHVSDEKEDVTEIDRKAVIVYLENHEMVKDYRVSELVDGEKAYKDSIRLVIDAIIQQLERENL